eukprot:scaffold12.g8237.t1
MAPSSQRASGRRQQERQAMELAGKSAVLAATATLACWCIWVAPRAAARAPCTGACLASQAVLNGTVQWVSGSGGWAEPQVAVRGVPLRRFSADEAAACLASANHSVAFVGDSLMRYQYISLVLFLESGEWPGLNTTEGPSPVVEKEWDSWWHYYQATTAALGGREACDCYRKEDSDGEWQAAIVENRRYELRAPAPGSCGGGRRQLLARAPPPTNATVSYFMHWRNQWPMHGHAGFPPAPGRPGLGCEPGNCSQAADWSAPLPEALATKVAAVRPTLLLVNQGVHWTTTCSQDHEPQKGQCWSDDFAHAVAAAGVAATALRRGLPLWRTTAAGRHPAEHPAVDAAYDGQALAHTAVAGWGVLDAFALTEPLRALEARGTADAWSDNWHFRGFVYRELNLYLLNILCPSL